MRPGARLSEVARRYGIAGRVLFRWKQEMMPAAAPTFVAVEITDADQERGVRTSCPLYLRETSGQVRKVPTAEVRRFTQSLRQREPAAMVAPYDRVGLAVRCAVVLSIPGHDQRWRFLSTSSARSACTVITNSLLITSSTVRSVSITNVTRCRGIIGIHPLTPNWRATT